MKNLLTFVNHACFYVENDDSLLLIDPWLEGPAFNNGWSLLDKSTSNRDLVEHLASSGKAIYIWYSHEHPDHFSISFIKALKQHLPRKVTFLFQQTKDRRVLGYLKANDFDVIECMSGTTVALDEHLALTVFPYENGDSYCLINAQGRTILNLNDCAVTSAAQCRRIAGRLRKLGGGVDVLLTQFGYANWVGNPDQPALRIKAAADKIRSVALQIEGFKPGLTIPFASFIYFSNPDNAYLNDCQNTAQATAAALAHPVRFLKPGDVVDLEQATAASLAAMSAAAVQHWTDLAQARRALLPFDASEPLENIGAMFSRYRQQVDKQLLFLPRALETVGLITPLAIHITDLGKIIRVSYRDGFSVLGEGAAFHLSMHSANAVFLFKNEYGFNTTHVNGRFGTATADALALFSRFFMPQNLVKNGYGVKHPFLTVRYLVGSVLSRTARWIGALAG